VDPVPFAVGSAGAFAVVAAERASGFGRDRSFYPTVLAVIAVLYVLFGVEDGVPGVIAAETAVAGAFVAVAVVAFRRRSATLLAAAGITPVCVGAPRRPALDGDDGIAAAAATSDLAPVLRLRGHIEL